MSARRAPAPARPSPGAATSTKASARGGNVASAWGSGAVVALLLGLHVALALWGALSNSVTFDENFHLPAGVAILARRDFGVSPAQPPLVKVVCAAAALAAGARPPAAAAIAAGGEAWVGESFMRSNADRYQRVYVAGRLVVIAMSVALGLLVWWFARRLYGGAAGLLALALYVAAPEALAHAGLVGMDLPTALAFLAAIVAFYRFIVTGSWKWWGWTAAALAGAFLTRFSALQLAPIFLAQAVVATALGRARSVSRLWIGLVLFVPSVLVAINLGYLGGDSFEPLGRYQFTSASFQRLQHAFPGLRVPLPREYVKGLNYIALMAQPGKTPTFLMGKIVDHPVWWYFPFALSIKWPLGFLSVLLARAAFTFRARPRPRSTWIAIFLGIPVVVMLGMAMFGSNLNVGVRYLLPALPILCVACGALAGRAPRPLPSAPSVAPAAAAPASARPWRAWMWAAVALAGLQAAEMGLAAPWYLSFYNWTAGGPGGGDRLVNDSNVDWGQGLIALRRELESRGISRIYLAYHGTADPALYGIDYVPYLGSIGAESDWIAVSSYYMVGLSQRMMTQKGRTTGVRFDFDDLERRFPTARPARCMYLYRVRWNGRAL